MYSGRVWQYRSANQKHREMIRVRNREGRSLDGIVSNFMFYGAPGTGKTTVVRQIARLLHIFGELATAHLLEKPKKLCATRGVMFMDEAYQRGELLERERNAKRSVASLRV